MEFYYFLPIAFILGMAFGSFNNVLIHRLPEGKDLGGYSRCPNCSNRLHWQDLIPVISFLLLRRKCRYCEEKISFYYPLVEIITGLAFAFVVFWVLKNLTGMSPLYYLPVMVFWLFFIDVLIVIFFTDLIYGLISDQIIFSSVIVAMLYQLFFPVFISSATYFSLKSSSSPIAQYLLPPHSDYIFNVASRSFVLVLYTLVAAFLLALIFYLIILFSKGRAMGGGDVKLGFLIGLITGWPTMVVAIFLGLLTGASLGVLLIAIGKKRFGQTVPFGPFLTLGTFVALFWGQPIFNWYINILNGR